jgi:hypothetical protein
MNHAQPHTKLTAMSSSVPRSLSTGANVPSVILDALPYVDAIHEDYEAYALALVEEEMTKISPSASTPKLPPLRASEMLQNEYEIVSKGEQRPPLELSKVEPPSSDTAEAWTKSIERARAEYEAERLRGQVLELEEKHAPDQWKHYTIQVLQTLEQDQIALYDAQKSILEEMHAQRQQEQLAAGETLGQLQQRYHNLIRKRHHLQMACSELEKHVNEMKQEPRM